VVQREKNLDYNVPGGKLNRGISVTDTVEIILGRPLDEKEYKRAAVLGWGVELVRRRRSSSPARIYPNLTHSIPSLPSSKHSSSSPTT
jgi:hypothetical protein